MYAYINTPVHIFNSFFSWNLHMLEIWDEKSILLGPPYQHNMSCRDIHLRINGFFTPAKYVGYKIQKKTTIYIFMNGFNEFWWMVFIRRFKSWRFREYKQKAWDLNRKLSYMQISGRNLSSV